MAPNPRRQDRALNELYQQIPKVSQCDGSCHGACAFIEPSPRERARLEEASGLKLETIDLALAEPGKLRALGWKPIDHTDPKNGAGWSADGTRLARHRCSMLTHDGRCSQYALRPMICRLYGTGTAGLKCHRGCEPDQHLNAVETTALLLKSFEIGGWPPGMQRMSASEFVEQMADPENLAAYQSFLDKHQKMTS